MAHTLTFLKKYLIRFVMSWKVGLIKGFSIQQLCMSAYLRGYYFTSPNIIRHDIAQDSLVLLCISLEEKEMWADSMNACECFHHLLHVHSYRPGVVDYIVYYTIDILFKVISMTKIGQMDIKRET